MKTQAAVLARFDQDVGQYGNGVAPLHHRLHMAQAFQQRRAFDRRFHDVIPQTGLSGRRCARQWMGSHGSIRKKSAPAHPYQTMLLRASATGPIGVNIVENAGGSAKPDLHHCVFCGLSAKMSANETQRPLFYCPARGKPYSNAAARLQGDHLHTPLTRDRLCAGRRHGRCAAAAIGGRTRYRIARFECGPRLADSGHHRRASGPRLARGTSTTTGWWRSAWAAGAANIMPMSLPRMAISLTADTMLLRPATRWGGLPCDRGAADQLAGRPARYGH